MISAIVLVSDSWRVDDIGRSRERVARSMAWLVSAVVGCLVRDVVLAVPAHLGLAPLADQSGCRLVEADAERDRLTTAVAICREPQIIVMRAGYQPDPGLIEEIDSLMRGEAAGARALLLEGAATLVQRFFPSRAAVAGVLTPSTDVSSDFDRLARVARQRGAKRLRARARLIL